MKNHGQSHTSLSVVVNTKNAAKTLKNALKSVKFADEIIVVDMASQDETLEIARSFSARIFSVNDVGYVEPARAVALEKAKCDWILVLDADEEISSTLAEEILEKITTSTLNSPVAYAIPRQNIMFGRAIEYTGWWPDYQLRLFKRGMVTWPSEIHAVPEVAGTTEKFPVKPELAIIHHNYQTIAQFVDRLNRYTTIQAGKPEYAETGFLRASLAKRTINAFKSEFLNRFFYAQAYKDGRHGLALSFLQSFSEFIVQLKVWEQQGFPQTKPVAAEERAMMDSLQLFHDELGFWLKDYQLQHTSGAARLRLKIKRKIAQWL